MVWWLMVGPEAGRVQNTQVDGRPAGLLKVRFYDARLGLEITGGFSGLLCSPEPVPMGVDLRRSGHFPASTCFLRWSEWQIPYSSLSTARLLGESLFWNLSQKSVLAELVWSHQR